MKEYEILNFVDISVLQSVMLIVGAVAVVFWILLYLKYSKVFGDYIAPLKSGQFFLQEVLFIGLGAMSMFRVNVLSAKHKKKLRNMQELYGEQYGEYYLYVTNGVKYTYILTGFPAVCLATALANDVLVMVLGAVAVGAIIYYLDIEVADGIKKREDKILSDLPSVLSKLTLLINAGLTTREAWNKVAMSGEGILYTEMQTTVSEMQNGVSEVDAYRAFADRCVVKEVRKFTSTLLQNMQKGNSEMVFFLREMADESWQQKKHLVKRKGEQASSKLMIPVGMMLIAILVMIIVPAFSGL